MKYCSPEAIQYTFLQLLNWPIMPANTRATRIPKSSPDNTMDIADARRCGGARSAAKGISTYGVELSSQYLDQMFKDVILEV